MPRDTLIPNSELTAVQALDWATFGCFMYFRNRYEGKSTGLVKQKSHWCYNRKYETNPIPL